MENFQVVEEIMGFLGFLVRALGFLVLGFALGRFMLDAYRKAVWQTQVALVLGFFILLVGLTNYATAGSVGMFALGAGAAFFVGGGDKKKDSEDKKE